MQGKQLAFKYKLFNQQSLEMKGLNEWNKITYGSILQRLRGQLKLSTPLK